MKLSWEFKAGTAVGWVVTFVFSLLFLKIFQNTEPFSNPSTPSGALFGSAAKWNLLVTPWVVLAAAFAIRRKNRDFILPAYCVMIWSWSFGAVLMAVLKSGNYDWDQICREGGICPSGANLIYFSASGIIETAVIGILFGLGVGGVIHWYAKRR